MQGALKETYFSFAGGCRAAPLFLARDDFGIKEELDWDLKHPVEIDPLITSDTRIFPDSIISPVLFTCQNCDYKIPNVQSTFCENCGTKIISLMVGFEGL